MIYYLSFFLGGALSILLIRWLTAYRFIMTLLCLAGLAIGAVAGVFLAYPLRSIIEPGAGALLGMAVWLSAWLHLLQENRTVSRRISSV